jgi:hypothetical protein
MKTTEGESEPVTVAVRYSETLWPEGVIVHGPVDVAVEIVEFPEQAGSLKVLIA